MIDLTITVHDIAADGLPPRGPDGEVAEHLRGRIAFIHNDALVSGEPIYRDDCPTPTTGTRWMTRYALFENVTHWVELPASPAALARCPPAPRKPRLSMRLTADPVVLRDGVPLNA